LGTVALSKALLPHFIGEQSGHFVVVASLMGKFGPTLRYGYWGAKHRLHGFFDILPMERQKDNSAVTLVCPGFVNTNLARNPLTGDGSAQARQDQATALGMDPGDFAQKMLKAIEKRKMEIYIRGKEVLGVHMKRFFPGLLHKHVLWSRGV
jgi:short-subunit dehydrogenase